MIPYKQKYTILIEKEQHQTTDTDNSEFRPALAARDGKINTNWNIPDGFYLPAKGETATGKWGSEEFWAWEYVRNLEVGQIMYDKDRDFLNKNFYYLQIMFSSFPEADCARAVMMFLSDYSRVVSGASVDVNGGEYMAP